MNTSSEVKRTPEMKGAPRNKANWNEQKGKLKKKFPILTDKDLTFETGKKDEMFDKLQVKLGKSKAELHKIVEAL